MCDTNSTIWYGEHSYIKAVKWNEFVRNYSAYIQSACERQNNIEAYDIYKEV